MPLVSRSENTCTSVSSRLRPPKRSTPPEPPFHGVLWPYDALNNEQRPTPCLPRPGCAASSGFLNLLTLYSAQCPSSLVSCWWRPWAFTYRGLLLDGSEPHLPVTRYPSCRSSPRVRRPSPPRLQGFSASIESVALGAVLPTAPEPVPLLALSPPRYYPRRFSASRMTVKPPLLGFGRTPSRRNALSLYLLFKVSENRRGRAPLSRRPSLPGVFGPTRSLPEGRPRLGTPFSATP